MLTTSGVAGQALVDLPPTCITDCHFRYSIKQAENQYKNKGTMTMASKQRKPKPSIPHWFHYEEYCITCKDKHACTACKYAKRIRRDANKKPR